MHCRLACAALLGAVLACTALALARGASALPLCNTGQIVKAADPTLSAPSPANPGSTITSSGGSWTSCGEALTGFYKEWLRDGTVVSGPTFVASSPASFTYVVQAADAGHIDPLGRAALQRRRLLQRLRVERERGRARRADLAAASTASGGPAAARAVVFRRGFRLHGDRRFRERGQPAVHGQPARRLIRDLALWKSTAGVYSESTAQPLLGSITGATSSFGLGLAARRCYTVDKHHTAHDSITRVVVWKFHQKAPLVCHVPRDRGAFVGSRLVLLRRRWAPPGGLGQSRQRLVVHVERQPYRGALLPPARQDRQLHPQVGLPLELLPANRALGERKRRLGCKVTGR